MKILINTALILSGTLSIFAQTGTFKWESELCRYEGTYDSSKYTEAELRDTQELMSSAGMIPLFTDTTAAKPEDIKSLSLEKLDKEYSERSAKLKSLNIVKNAYWEQIRQAKLKELEQFYRLSRITIQGYENPSVLKDFKKAECCIDFYVEPLIAGGDYLTATWLKVNMDSRSRNASPERLKRIFDQQNASPDRLKFALTEVMSFGWWNCAITQINMVEHNEQVNENFYKLFTNVKEECDEP